MIETSPVAEPPPDESINFEVAGDEDQLPRLEIVFQAIGAAVSAYGQLAERHASIDPGSHAEVEGSLKSISQLSYDRDLLGRLIQMDDQRLVEQWVEQLASVASALRAVIHASVIDASSDAFRADLDRLKVTANRLVAITRALQPLVVDCLDGLRRTAEEELTVMQSLASRRLSVTLSTHFHDEAAIHDRRGDSWYHWMLGLSGLAIALLVVGAWWASGFHWHVPASKPSEFWDLIPSPLMGVTIIIVGLVLSVANTAAREHRMSRALYFDAKRRATSASTLGELLQLRDLTWDTQRTAWLKDDLMLELVRVLFRDPVLVELATEKKHKGSAALFHELKQAVTGPEPNAEMLG